VIVDDLAASGGAPVPQLVVPDTVFVDRRIVAPGEPHLVWPAGAALSLERSGGELVVRYDRPPSEQAIRDFREAAGDMLGDLRWNDVTLMLRPAAGWRMDARVVGPALIVGFALVAADTDDVQAAPADPARELAHAAIEADLAAGYPGRGRRQAQALLARDPGDGRAARLLADARAIDGDTAGAARGYRALGADDRSARRTIASGGGTAAMGLVAREGGDLGQVEASLRADVPVADAVAMGGGLRHLQSRVDTPERRRDRAATVADASLAVALGDAARLQLLASAALDDGVTGGGARITYGPAEAQWRLTLTRHMPDYATPAQVLAAGYLSRAALGATYRLSSGLVAQGEVGLNRYGLAGERAASDTVTLAAGLEYLIRRRYPLLGLSYRVEAEYVRRALLDAGGAMAIPLADRENHTVQAMLGEALGAVQLTGLAGWTVDRFGGDGPNVSLALAAPIGLVWRVEASGGLTSISRPGFSGQQLFGRAVLTRSLGRPR